MIVQTVVVGYQCITTKKNSVVVKYWVSMDSVPLKNLKGRAYSEVVQYQPSDVEEPVGKSCMIAVDNFGRVTDIQIFKDKGGEK